LKMPTLRRSGVKIAGAGGGAAAGCCAAALCGIALAIVASADALTKSRRFQVMSFSSVH
jgi:hypothetical protein